MSSDEDYLFDEEDRDSGNESPENSDDDDEEDWGMDIGLGTLTKFLFKNSEAAFYSLRSIDVVEIFYIHPCFVFEGDEQGPSGSIEGHGLRASGRSGDPGGRGDPDDYYYEVR